MIACTKSERINFQQLQKTIKIQTNLKKQGYKDSQRKLTLKNFQLPKFREEENQLKKHFMIFIKKNFRKFKFQKIKNNNENNDRLSMLKKKPLKIRKASRCVYKGSKKNLELNCAKC